MELPSATTRSLAEVNCRLCDVEASSQSLSAPACPDIFIQSGHNPTIDPASIPVRSPAGVWPQNYTDSDGGNEIGAPSHTGPSLSLQAFTKPALDHIKSAVSQLCNIVGSGSGINSLQSKTQQASSLAWHPRQPILAAVDSSSPEGECSLHIFDFSNKIPYLGQQTQNSVPPLSPSVVLKHDLQQAGASTSGALAWRPTNSASLAVGCAHGVCLWLNIPTTKQPQSTDTSLSTSLVWLQSPGEVAVDTLCWHPQGHLLAGTSRHRPGLFLWDVATGSVTSIRAGLEHVIMLRWSPCGCYLFAGGKAGSFRIWETVTWKSAKWEASRGGGTSASGGGKLVGAEWSPDGRTFLLAFSHQIAALHLTADIPALTAQVLPVPLAELTSADSGGSGRGIPTVQSVAWDPRGQRLAIALEFKKKEGIQSQSQSSSAIVTAIYDARCDPILTARFIGYARVVPFGEYVSDADWEVVEREGLEIDEKERDVQRMPVAVAKSGGGTSGSNEKVSMAFMPSFAQGAVLSVRKGGFIGTLPMYFSS